MKLTLDITTHIDGRRIPRADVLGWEARRGVVVAKKLGIIDRPTDVVTLRRVVVERKRALGHARIEQLLERELRWSARIGRLSAMLSGRRRRPCTIELTAHSGAAELVPQWYHAAMTANDEVPLIAACPDHYISRSHPDGAQEVIETTGGAPLAVRMFFDSADLSTLATAADGAFPTQWAGIARSADGMPLGGIRHQFRDNPRGFHVRLTVEFPVTTPTFMIAAHQWHLACEFSNWIEEANRAG